MKKVIAIFIFFALCIQLNAQNTSVGMNLGAFNFHNNSQLFDSGIQLSGNIRSQFNNTYAWQTEVGYAKFNQVQYIDDPGFPPNTIEPSTIKVLDNFIMMRSSIAVKLFEINGLYGEVLVGPGLYKRSRSEALRGLATGELFLSARVTNKIVLGIPVSFNYVFWDRDAFYSVGLSMRYHI